MAGVDVANPASDRPPLDPSQDVEEGEILSPRALLPSAEDPQKKHPLEHSWTFWFDSPSGKSKAVEWGSSLKPVYTFSTVEDFWCLFNNVHPPTQLVPGSDFHCFKEGIKPEWEDPKCANGGKWTISLSTRKPVFDMYWLHTLLALIGEQFDEGDEICGVVASVRPRGDKLSLWTKTATNEAAQMSVGKQWKQILDFSEKIGYLVHEDSKGTKPRARYNV